MIDCPTSFEADAIVTHEGCSYPKSLHENVIFDYAPRKIRCLVRHTSLMLGLLLAQHDGRIAAEDVLNDSPHFVIDLDLSPSTSSSLHDVLRIFLSHRCEDDGSSS